MDESNIVKTHDVILCKRQNKLARSLYNNMERIQKYDFALKKVRNRTLCVTQSIVRS